MIACAGVGGVCVAPSRARPMLAAATCFSLPSFVALNEFYVNFTSADFCQSNTETSHTPSLSLSPAPCSASPIPGSLAQAINLHFSTTLTSVSWLDRCVCVCVSELGLCVCVCVHAHNDKFNNNLALSSTKYGRETP